MTLDEAIRHAEEVAEDAKIFGMMEGFTPTVSQDLNKCADEHRQLAEWLKELKRIREAATDTDTISRQAALDALGEAPEVWTDSPEEFAALNQWEYDLDAIKAVPSAEPKTGEWIIATGMMPPEFHGHHICSECSNFANMEPPFGNREDLSKFCPNCGARMDREDGEA